MIPIHINDSKKRGEKFVEKSIDAQSCRKNGGFPEEKCKQYTAREYKWRT
jgi:hypothetical protein